MLTKKNKPNIRTRIAPSPTGALHIGTARTALFNYLFAKHYGGKFFLRIEDTDIERSKPEFEKDIVENLKWLGLKWDGRILKQSQRKNVYRKYLTNLLKSGAAFWCFHTKNELKKEKEYLRKAGKPQVHFCSHKNKSDLKIENFKNKSVGVIRLKCDPERKIQFRDLIRGEIKFSANQIGDIVIAKDEFNPLYNFAVVIDDYETKITHVIRGEDHISNTPKQIMIYEALKLSQPHFAHLPLILGPDKNKLSKRHGAVAIAEYRREGYLPEALINFMAFLGWNPGDERNFFSLKELIKEFSIERVQKGPAIFNLEKLNFLNGWYIRKLSEKRLTELCLPYLIKKGLIKQLSLRSDRFKIIETGEIINMKLLQKIMKLEQERIKKLSEIGEMTKFFFHDVLEYDTKLLQWKDMTNQEIKSSLDICYNILSDLESRDFLEKKLRTIFMTEAEKMRDRGQLLWPLRVALTGLKASPGPFEILEVLGKKKALKRIKLALEKIS